MRSSPIIRLQSARHNFPNPSIRHTVLDVPPIQLRRELIFEFFDVRLYPKKIGVVVWWISGAFVAQRNETMEVLVVFRKFECMVCVTVGA